jgi:type IV secretion system protein VirB9
MTTSKIPKDIIALHIAALCAFPLLLAFTITGNGQADAEGSAAGNTSVLRVIEQEDQIITVRTKVRHTTVLVLPRTENILDFVVGDSDYWALTGSANVAYVKPLAEALDTNVTLVCASGRIYAFLVTEASPPHLVVRVEREQKTNSNQISQPAFVARSQVEGYQLAAQQAAEQAAAASQDARKRVETAEKKAQSAAEQFRADYPTTLQWPYRLERGAFQDPFLVEAMWRDDRFTYLRSRAQETPALYELRDGKPSLVAYDLEENGLFIVRRLLSDGWLQVGDKKAKWRLVTDDK